MRLPLRLHLPTAVALLLALPARGQPRTAEWCEQQWRAASAASVPDQATKVPVEAADAKGLLARWQSRARECQGTVVYEARLALAHLIAGQPEKAREILAPLAGRPSPYAHLVEFASAMVDYLGMSTEDEARRAEATFAGLVARHPDFPEAHGMLGSLRTILGRHAEAIPSLERGSRSAMNTMGVYRNLTISYAAVGRFEDAARAADQAVEGTRALFGDPDFMLAVARTKAMTGKPEVAVTSIRILASEVKEARNDPRFAEVVRLTVRKLDERTTARIEEALAALLRRPKGAFVVFEVKGKERFVQFAGSREEQLILDLPEAQLDAGGRKKADELFGKEGGTFSLAARAFQLELGRDVARGAALARRVLREVLGEPAELELAVSTGQSAPPAVRKP